MSDFRESSSSNPIHGHPKSRTQSRQRLANVLHMQNAKPNDKKDGFGVSSLGAALGLGSTSDNSAVVKKTTKFGSAKEGKEGWLWRFNEGPESVERGPFIRYWCVVDCNRLLYYSRKPKTKNSDKEEIIDEAIGFVFLNKDTVLLMEAPTVDSSEATGVGKFCFRLTERYESDSVSFLFSATSEADMRSWTAVLYCAMDGHVHVNEAITRTISASSKKPDSGTLEKNESIAVHKVEYIDQDMELPRMTGLLNKKAISGTLGYRNKRPRWFRLESGILKYYEKESLKPSSLKGSINLETSAIVEESVGGCHFALALGSGNNLEVEAPSADDASRWLSAIGRSIKMLKGQETREQTTTTSFFSKNTKRKVNVVLTRAGDGNQSAQLDMLAPLDLKGEETVEILQRSFNDHFLLSSLYDKVPVMSRMEAKTALPGDVIVWQGAIGDKYFAIESGSTQALVNEKEVARMGKGKGFGELALINDVKRAASVRCTELTKVWVLSRQVFRLALQELELKKRREIMNILQKIDIFQRFNEASLKKVAESLAVEYFEEESKIFNQGDHGDVFYIVADGIVSIQERTGFNSKELARLGPGKHFGETSLINGGTRNSSAVCATDVCVYTIDKARLTSLLGIYENVLNEEIAKDIIAKVELLSNLDHDQVDQLVQATSKMTFEAGDKIITQGDEGNEFYMISSGTVSVQVNHVPIAELGPGQYFGERSLLSADKRSATIVALQYIELLVLERDEFNELLGPLQDLIDKNSAERERKGLWKSMFSKQEVQKPRNLFECSPEDVTEISKLGKGRFSIITSVLHDKTRNFYAMKKMSKQLVVHLNHQDAICRSNQILTSIREEGGSDFLAMLYSTFSDQNCLYHLMELVPAGDMHSLLYCTPHLGIDESSCGGIKRSFAAFYVANVLSAIEFLHSKGLIYRNMRLENVVMGADGFLKLVDLSLCTHLGTYEEATTICGCAEFLTPEIILGKPYRFEVDFWGLGVLAYELLMRKTPFSDNLLAVVYHKILNCDGLLAEQAFPEDCDPVARSFVTQTVTAIAHSRLGMQRGGTKEIWTHPFMMESGVTCEGIRMKSLVAPYVPEVSSGDTINFETEFSEIESVEDGIDIPYTGQIDFSDF
jgi:CRP-like cAMP-binding protein